MYPSAKIMSSVQHEERTFEKGRTHLPRLASPAPLTLFLLQENILVEL